MKPGVSAEEMLVLLAINGAENVRLEVVCDIFNNLYSEEKIQELLSQLEKKECISRCQEDIYLEFKGGIEIEKFRSIKDRIIKCGLNFI